MSPPRKLFAVGPSLCKTARAIAEKNAYELVFFPMVELSITPLTDQFIENFRRGLAAHSLLFTSKHAVFFFFSRLNILHIPLCIENAFSVGQQTTTQIHSYAPHMTIFTSKQEDQEGLSVEIAQHPPRSLFWPHSLHSRQFLSESLLKQNIFLTELALYQPIFKKELPPLQDGDGVFFSSPSSVQAFFSSKPEKDIRLAFYSIGQVTKEKFKELYGTTIHTTKTSLLI